MSPKRNIMLAVATTTIGFFWPHSGLYQHDQYHHHYQHHHHHHKQHHHHHHYHHHDHHRLLLTSSQACTQVKKCNSFDLMKSKEMQIQKVITCGQKLLLSQCWSLQMYWQLTFLFIFQFHNNLMIVLLTIFPFQSNLDIWQSRRDLTCRVRPRWASWRRWPRTPSRGKSHIDDNLLQRIMVILWWHYDKTPGRCRVRGQQPEVVSFIVSNMWMVWLIDWQACSIRRVGKCERRTQQVSVEWRGVRNVLIVVGFRVDADLWQERLIDWLIDWG